MSMKVSIPNEDGNGDACCRAGATTSKHTHGCARREMASSAGSARNKFSPPMKSFCARGEDGRK
jgi:hypothetical protein